MDPLGTIKKFHVCSSHIGEDFWPANENCLFSDATKPKTTCSFLTIFSSCICISIATFQTSFNFTVYWFFFWKIFIFWLKCTKNAANEVEHFLAKTWIWIYLKWWGKPSKRTYIVPIMFILNTLQRYLGQRKILIFVPEKNKFFCFLSRKVIIHCCY